MILKYLRRLRGREQTTLDNERLRREKKELERLIVHLNRAITDYKRETKKVMTKNAKKLEAAAALTDRVRELDKAFKNIKKDHHGAIKARDKEWMAVVEDETKKLKEEVKKLKEHIERQNGYYNDQKERHEKELERLWTEKMETYDIPYKYRQKFIDDGGETIAQNLLGLQVVKNLYIYADIKTALEARGFELEEGWQGIPELKYSGKNYEGAISAVIEEVCKAIQKITDRAASLQQTVLNLETSTTKDIEIARLRNSMNQMEIKIDALNAQLAERDQEIVP